MITDKEFLELVFNSAWCYVPLDGLSEEQRKRVDSTRFRWCRCRTCSRAIKWHAKTIRPQARAHLGDKTHEVCFSRPYFRTHMDDFIPEFLLELIAVALHEIVHITFPEFDERETIEKTFEWLRESRWVDELQRLEGSQETD